MVAAVLSRRSSGRPPRQDGGDPKSALRDGPGLRPRTRCPQTHRTQRTVDSALIDISRLDLCEELFLLLLADNLHRCTMRGDNPAEFLVELGDLDRHVLANQ